MASSSAAAPVKKKEMKAKGNPYKFQFETGAVITQNFKASDTIASVLEGIYAVGSTLMFAGKQLEHRRTLSHYKIQKNSTLHVALSPAPSTPDPLNEPRQRRHQPNACNFVGYDASKAYTSWFKDEGGQ